MSTAREDPKAPAIGYPIELSSAQSNYQLSGHPPPPRTYPTTNTAYTNVVQYPPADINPSPAHSAKPELFTCKDRLQFAAFTAFLALVLLPLMIFLTRPPSVKFQVKSVSVSTFNMSASQITANWNVTLYVRNPNKKTRIYYELVGASLFYKEQFLSTAALLPFYQDPKDDTVVQLSLAASSMHIKKWIDAAISFDRAAHGALVFKIKVEGMVRLDPGTDGESKRLLSVSCGNLKVDFWRNTTSGTMLGGSRKCKAHIYA